MKRLLSKNAVRGVIPYLKDKHSCVTGFFFRFGEWAPCRSVGLLQSAVRREDIFAPSTTIAWALPTRKSLIKDPFILLQAVLMPSCTRYIFQVR